MLEVLVIFRAIVFLFLVLPVMAGAVFAKGSASEGAKQFEKHQCSGCHRAGGNSVEPSKPLKGEAFAKKYATDAQIVAVIRKGVPGTAMPANTPDMLPERELNDIVAYIRSLTPCGSSTGAKPKRK